MSIKENLEKIRKEIGGKDVLIVGISKNFSIEDAKEAINAGLTDIGENRIQEAENKLPKLSNVRKHFVGHLQSNKVAKAIEIFDMIQSVNSLKIAKKISNVCTEKNKTTPVLIQILTDENKQFGILPKELEAFLKEASLFKGIRIRGLMTIGPFFKNPEDSRPVFKRMKSLFDSVRDLGITNIEMRYLSMGMSDDFRIAVEEGANMVRIGRKIFGEREQ